MSPKLLNLILKALDANGHVVFSRDDAAWPKEDFDEAIRTGLLEEAAPADEVLCPGCEDACPEDVEFVYGDKTTDTRAYVVCGQRDDVGRVRIPLEMLDRWAVNVQRAKQLRTSGPCASDRTKSLPKTKRPKATATQNAMLLLAALPAHHKFDSDQPNWEPATSRALEQSLQWGQPKVSRAFKTLFGPSGMARYRASCKEKKIKGFLKKYEDGSQVVEAADPHSLMQ